MSINTRRLVRSLAEERGYTMAGLVEEAVARGYGTREEAVASLRRPIYSCPMFAPVLEDILGLSGTEVKALYTALWEDARVEMQRRCKAA